MRAKTFLEIHEALLNKAPIVQCNFESEKNGLYNGLCDVWLNNRQLKDNEIFYLVMPAKPTDKAYWACSNELYNDFGTEYNELRQNIILLCAAINNEL